ncbi:RNA polymerase sigma-70 factor, ECF subfamily [Psychrobacillus sp. OK028]|uniref:RNA polymerase sigma factor n=1 Tax=Psychrobacillus sp. OK028 TaxID=1884359 RepID=UPI00089093F2|nr:RNA polymerase sigma factor [Psychrobacillus sp. OK028]SDO25657.1 RNA polymerase sigma-70 factor, ECF subfamily [Psychrobacillus sp. OK028]
MEQKILMTRIRNGEDEAFAQLVNPLIEKGYRTSFSILKSKELAEEVVQTAVIEAYRNIMSGKEIIYFNTWFYKLVSYRSIDAWRKNDRLKESPLEIDVVTDKRGVVESVLKEETDNEIKKGILSLDNSDYQIILILYYYQEQAIQEISDLLGLKSSTVKSHLRRARNALKKRLIENQFIEVNSQ